jgi:hypothetical protein
MHPYVLSIRPLADTCLYPRKSCWYRSSRAVPNTVPRKSLTSRFEYRWMTLTQIRSTLCEYLQILDLGLIHPTPFRLLVLCVNWLPVKLRFWGAQLGKLRWPPFHLSHPLTKRRHESNDDKQVISYNTTLRRSCKAPSISSQLVRQIAP